jgi:hypothetical protein
LATATFLPEPLPLSLPVMRLSDTTTSSTLPSASSLLELAVGHHLDRLRRVPPLLQHQHGEQREDDVDNVELRASFHIELIFKQELDLKRRPKIPICLTGTPYALR